VCEAARKKEWYEANKQRISQEQKERWSQTREQVNKERRDQYAQDEARREQVSYDGKVWREANKEAISAKSKANYEADPEKFKTKVYRHRQKNLDAIRKRDRRASLKKLYGLTPEDYETMKANQSGGCAICGRTVVGNKRHQCLHVDHDHATGKVRGLLCHTCNTGLGAFKDSPDLMAKAADYLKRSKSWQ
jgi:hypothetical protein